MYDLVRLYLFELRDFKTLGEGNYSRQTEYLVDQMLQKFLLNKGVHTFPESYQFGTFHWIQAAAYGKETNEKLRALHTIFSLYHQRLGKSGGNYPATAGLIEDLWRYAWGTSFISGGGGKPKQRAKEFFDKLSNLR